jgi:PTS system mannitol-specific IIC component
MGSASKTGSIKVKVQAFGRFLSGMVMPNIGAFIAWGFITALFIPTGWFPNEKLATLVGPMIIHLLPLLIGYTGGKMIGGVRGGVVGAITTSGVIVGTSIPMFLGAMIAGPLGGYVIKKFDDAIEGKVKSGFEMLVNNFSAGIIGMILALVCFLGIGPLVEVLNTALGNGVNKLVALNLLPLTSLIVEPAKILFLNNAINHGVFSPLGIQQSTELGKSIFFMIEANPGPGLGILLAYSLFGKGAAKQSAPGAAIIHFFGGIHEIYFPYVLMKPFLLLAAIAGGMTGVLTYSILGAGLIAPPSPGSIFALLAMTPKGGLFVTLTGVITAATVSCIVSILLLKSPLNKDASEDEFEAAADKMKELKNKPTTSSLSEVAVKGAVSKIVVACDAGMGSSAMGAGLLRKKVKAAGLKIDVTNKAINDLTEDIDIVITHKDLTPRAMNTVKNPTHLSLKNFMDGEFYDNLVEKLKSGSATEGAATTETEKETESSEGIFSKKNIYLGLKSVSKEDAIKAAGRALADAGYVKDGYLNAMLDRENKSTTFIGNGVAIPHGTAEAKGEVLKAGIVLMQYPQGVDFGDDNIAKLIIGIAGKNNEHIDIISNIADVIEDEEVVEELSQCSNIDEIHQKFMI